MSNQQGSRYGDLMGLWTVRGSENESRISEQWHDIFVSRFKVRMYQWFGAIVGIFFTQVGAIMLGTPLALTLGRSNIKDTLLVGVMVGLGAIAASGGTAYLFKDSRSQMVGAIISTGLVSFVVLAVVLATIAFSDEMDWWRALLAMAGTCIFTPSLALAFFLLSDLVDPMGWVSAFERMMRPELKKYMQALSSQYTQVKETPLVPWNQHSDRKLITSKSKARDTDSNGVEKVPYHLDIELADFLKEALVRGLARDSGWLDKKKAAPYILPSTGATVRRNKYDMLVAHAIKHGYVHKTDDATTWAVADPAKDAYDHWCRQIEAEWKDYLEVEGE